MDMDKAIKEKVVEIVRQYSKCNFESENLRLINDMGMDSLSILQLAVELEDYFEIKIDDEEIGKAENFGRVDSLIKFIYLKVGDQIGNNR